jgi:hypothetical protein
MWRYGANTVKNQAIKKKHLQYKGWAVGNRKEKCFFKF